MPLLFAQHLIGLYTQTEPHSLRDTVANRLSLARVKLGQKLLRSPLHKTYLQLCRHLPGWVRTERSRYSLFSRETARRLPGPGEQTAEHKSWKNHPKISILLTTHGTKERWIKEAVESVFAQSYENWQLCIGDDASGLAWFSGLLTDWQARDSRVCVDSSPSRRGISAALNSAAAMATGEFVAFLDHDDVLDPMALHFVAAQMQDRSPDIIYTDEDFIDSNSRLQRPHFKPAWSPHLLNGCMYLGHLVVMRRSLFHELGGFRTEFDGAQDYDLALRASERQPMVVHVPYVAYHWRMHPESMAQSPGNKPYTHELGKRAVEESLQRRGLNEVSVLTNNVPNLYFLRRKESNFARNGVEVIRHLPQVRSLNASASATNAEYLIFVDARLKEAGPETLDLLVAPLSYPGVGIVGGKIQLEDGRILHAGFAFGGGSAVHLGLGTFGNASWPWLAVSREVSAVSGNALCVRKDVFESLGGFDAALPAPYYAIDFCLRAAQSGLTTMIETSAIFTLTRDEPLEPAASWDDWVRFMTRWGAEVSAPDAFYSPQLPLVAVLP
ncbi:MAG: glycosyltransferase [Acidobacteriota bacterium]